MNRAVSMWKKLFFRNNIGRIRKTVVDYLKGEGLKVQIESGLIFVELDECYYTVDFDLEGEYPKCGIEFRIKSEEYEALELSQKTFVADKVNTDDELHSVVKAFNDEIMVVTHFYFNNKEMLLSLFYEHFTDLKDTVDEMSLHLMNVVEENRQKQQRRPIGFTISTFSKEEKNPKVAACNEQNMY